MLLSKLKRFFFFFLPPKFFSFQVPILDRYDFRYFYLDLKCSKRPCQCYEICSLSGLKLVLLLLLLKLVVWSNFSKKSLQRCIQGVNAHATLEKSSVFMNGCWEHCFLAAKAGLWMGTYQQKIAWNLDLSRVEVEWNLPCHRTSCCFFFKICPPSMYKKW